MSTLEDLYLCFEKYTPAELFCCSCCHEDDFVAYLQKTDLRSLNSSSMYDYLYSALYTCEGMAAFKYFLPRLIELYPDELWLFQSKFEFINWEEWDVTEVNAIKTHFRTLWISGDRSVRFSDYFSFFSFDEIFGFWTENKLLLRQCLPHVADFKFSTIDEKEKVTAMVENLFFEEVDRDPTFADELSAAVTYIACVPPWE